MTVIARDWQDCEPSGSIRVGPIADLNVTRWRRSYDIPPDYPESSLPVAGDVCNLRDETQGTGVGRIRILSVTPADNKNKAQRHLTVDFYRMVRPVISSRLRLRSDVVGSRYYTGYRVVMCESGGIIRAQDAVIRQPYPGVSGDNIPICIEADGTFDPPGYPGLAQVVETYESARKPGKATLTVEIAPASRERMVREPGTNGRTIEGYDPNDPGVYYQVTAGDNHVDVMGARLRLSTAFKGRMAYEKALGLGRKVNKSAVILLGRIKCKAETLRCVGVETRATFGDDITYADLILAWNGLESWNEGLKVRAGGFFPIQRSVLNSSDVAVTPAKNAITSEFRPLRNYPSEESRTLFEPSDDFKAVIGGLTAW